ncbi:hypothetical protein FKR81_39605 [Lentzea tibetensis]|uniref:PLAT domain-containing protein n=1 Tax=Lentzea tibetensis TaxID=2591470 RepID=A0A563EGY5_9PSEU|nr:hypothetical protein [Lentzea tibetensis]TWP45191.1 hypothetical protein FKR81_39605 [Lentzea tibetensis]
MKTTSAVLAAAACLAVAVLPASAAERPSFAESGERPPVSIELTPGKGVAINKTYGYWEARSSAEFSVKVTDKGDGDLDEMDAYVFVPAEVEVTGFSGEGWDCWDVEGGIECHTGHLVVPGEAWPTLTVRNQVHSHMNEPGAIEVWVTTGRYGWAGERVPFKTNTST